MRSFHSIAVVLFSVSFSTSVFAVPIQWKPEVGGNGHYYELIPQQTYDWFAAYNASLASSYLGVQGHLLTIASQAENDFIYNTYNDGRLHAVWIGLTDNEAFGGQESGSPANPGAPYWVWVTGESVTYVNWVTDANGSVAAPNNQNGTEDFGEFVFSNTDGTPGRWNDLDSFYVDPNQRYYIIEYDVQSVPEPTSLALWATALGGILIAQRRRRSAA